MPHNVFISYSHADSSLVGPIVTLLRATQVLTFLDTDGIRPGKRWRGEIDAAIVDASLFLLFWCHHSKASVEVNREYSAAISLGKDVLPILMDETELPTVLSAFHYIDFQGKFRHETESDLEPTQESQPSRTRSSTSLGLSLPLIGVAAAVAAIAYLSMKFGLPRWPIKPVPGISTSTWTEIKDLIVPFLIFGLMVDQVRRRKRHPDNAHPDMERSSDTREQEEIASAIEAEVVRRIGSRLPGQASQVAPCK